MAYYQGNNPFKKVGEEYTTHGKPNTYYDSSGNEYSSKHIDEGNLSEKIQGSWVTVQDKTDRFPKNTILFTQKPDSALVSKAREYELKKQRIQSQMGG